MSSATPVPTMREFPINARQQTSLRRLQDALQRGGAAEIAAARDEVVTTHLTFAAAMGRRYRDRGVEADDVQQIAYLGLVKAAHRWDPKISTAFLTYASPTILGEIKRYFRDHLNTVRIPRPLQELHAEAAALQAEMQQRHHRDATDSELAAAAGVAVDSIRDEQTAFDRCRVASLDQPELHSIAEQTTSPNAAADLRHVEDRLLATQAMCTLTSRERRIVQLRYEDGYSQQDIAQAIGVSQMQVSRLLRRIADKIRSGLAEPDDRADYLPPWLQLAG